MEFIRDVYEAKAAAGKPVISFEFFPPRTDEGDALLLQKTIPALKRFSPDFCSVTYGAGGSTREKTLAIVDLIQREHGLTALAHLTCVNATVDELRSILKDFARLGVKNVLALRGDPPGGQNEFQKTEGGFEFSWQLVRLVKEMGGFSIGTAGFPEGHIACKEGRETDWDRLKAKIDCGADFVLTQLFFDNQDFYRFREYLGKKGVSVPISAGIIPVQSASQIKKFTALCGARLPESLRTSLEKHANDDVACAEFGVEYATQQCAELLRSGVSGLHFYTLNKASSTKRILDNLRLAVP